MTTESKQEKGELQQAEPSRVPSPIDEMDRWWRGLMHPFHTEWPRWGELAVPFEGRMPKVDVIDRDDEVMVRAEVPGVDKDDLVVSVSDNRVTIKGETRREEKEEKGDYYRCEISRGSFARTVPLPSDVDSEKIEVQFKDGVLELTIPKKEKSKRRTIKID